MHIHVEKGIEVHFSHSSLILCLCIDHGPLSFRLLKYGFVSYGICLFISQQFVDEPTNPIMTRANDLHRLLSLCQPESCEDQYN
jgi:hypothetical protein